jgi:hypothetical protein
MIHGQYIPQAERGLFEITTREVYPLFKPKQDPNGPFKNLGCALTK